MSSHHSCLSGVNKPDIKTPFNSMAQHVGTKEQKLDQQLAFLFINIQEGIKVCDNLL